MTVSPKIYISILTYNSAQIIEPLLKSLENQTNKNFVAFVFDNGSKDKIEEVCAKFSFLNFFNFNNNTGYSGGNNQAFEFFKKNFPDFHYFLIINPDTILEPNLVEEMLIFTKNQKDFVLANPLLHTKDGYFATQKFLGLTLTPTFQQVVNKDRNYLKVKWCSGCCLLVNAEKISNPLFKDYFMYYEDSQISIEYALKFNQNYCINSTSVSHEDDPTPKPYKVYYCELNRFKFITDTFNRYYLIIYFPVYLFFRFLIFLNIVRVFKFEYPYKDHILGNLRGLKYFFTHILKTKNNPSFITTLKFCFFN